MLTFLHISDSHIGPTPEFELHGVNTFASFRRLVEHICALPHQPDFVLHTGDLSNDRSTESYLLASEVLSQLEVPIFFVAGNHDSRARMRQILGAPAAAGGDPDAPLDYVFTVRGERFVVLDATAAEVPDPLGKLEGSQLRWLQEVCQGTDRLTVIQHFLPFRTGSPWADANMVLVNGDALHAALWPIRERLRAVFFGHYHRGCVFMRDGILYAGAPASSLQYRWHSTTVHPEPDAFANAAYHQVIFREQDLLITYEVL
ncbi:MAG: hypothetical protein Kow0077_16750 [Anaerolineae bacterium]